MINNFLILQLQQENLKLLNLFIHLAIKLQLKMNNTSEQLLTLIMEVYQRNGESVSMIECLNSIIEELNISEEDVVKLLDDNIKSILKTNSYKHRLFRKQFYQPPTMELDI